MSIYLQQTLGILSKDLCQWKGDLQAAQVPILIPLVMLLICTILYGFAGDEWNIGLIVESEGPATQELVRSIEDARGNISPYFRIVTRDAATAKALLQKGRLHMSIRIPQSFERQITAGKTPAIHTRLFNINTDMTKNVRLRLDHALQDFAIARGLAPLTVTQFTTRPTDIWRRSFIAGSTVILTLLIGAALNTAIMIAREWEQHTFKEIQLSPRSTAALITGKLLTGLLTTIVNIGIMLIISTTLFGLKIPPERWLALTAVGLLAILSGAGIGLGAGAILRDYRTLQPLFAMIGATSFFVAGGFVSAAFLPPAMRALNTFWPPAYVFETMQAIMHGAAPPELFGTLLSFSAAAIVCTGFGAGMLQWVLSAGSPGNDSRHK